MFAGISNSRILKIIFPKLSKLSFPGTQVHLSRDDIFNSPFSGDKTVLKLSCVKFGQSNLSKVWSAFVGICVVCKHPREQMTGFSVIATHYVCVPGALCTIIFRKSVTCVSYTVILVWLCKYWLWPIRFLDICSMWLLLVLQFPGWSPKHPTLSRIRVPVHATPLHFWPKPTKDLLSSRLVILTWIHRPRPINKLSTRTCFSQFLRFAKNIRQLLLSPVKVNIKKMFGHCTNEWMNSMTEFFFSFREEGHVNSWEQIASFNVTAIFVSPRLVGFISREFQRNRKQEKKPD